MDGLAAAQSIAKRVGRGAKRQREASKRRCSAKRRRMEPAQPSAGALKPRRRLGTKTPWFQVLCDAELALAGAARLEEGMNDASMPVAAAARRDDERVGGAVQDDDMDDGIELAQDSTPKAIWGTRSLSPPQNGDWGPHFPERPIWGSQTDYPGISRNGQFGDPEMGIASVLPEPRHVAIIIPEYPGTADLGTPNRLSRNIPERPILGIRDSPDSGHSFD